MWFVIFLCRCEVELIWLYFWDYDLYYLMWKVYDLKNFNGFKGNYKLFDVFDFCKVLIKRLKYLEVWEWMLKFGYNENLLLFLNFKSLGKEFREVCKILGIEDLWFYDLRYEGCIWLVE